MYIRRFFLFFPLLLLFGAGMGCRNSETNANAPTPAVPLSPDTVVRIHWAGKRELGISANAYYVVRLWELPETKKVEVQFLKNMAVAPWRILFGDAAVERAPAALFGPLLQDVIKEECYFEMRRSTNPSPELAFAIKLDEQRAGVWRTNLVGVIASLTGIQNMDVTDGGHGWSLKQETEPKHFRLSRIGEWTVVGIGHDELKLMREVGGRISKFGSPGALSREDWLDADLDLEQLLGVSLRRHGVPGALPRISLSVTGDGANVIARGKATFPNAVLPELEGWKAPTNLLEGPMESFVAIRGVRSWLADFRPWQSTQLGPPPDQLYLWGLEGNPYWTFLAAPLPDSSQAFRQFCRRIIDNGNPWLEARGYVGFQPLSDTNGAVWGSLPNIRPFFTLAGDGPAATLYAGLLPPAGPATNHAVRADIMKEFSASTNLVAYQWEETGSRLKASIAIGEFVRLISKRPQFPLKSVSAIWLKDISPRLAETETRVFRIAPNQLSFERKATTGLTAMELSLLVDWLESPRFPLGLYTTVAPGPAAPESK